MVTLSAIEREGGRQRERQRECVCVCVYMYGPDLAFLIMGRGGGMGGREGAETRPPQKKKKKGAKL